jgi:unsaturated chondroitin disaccharide hydrolase
VGKKRGTEWDGGGEEACRARGAEEMRSWKAMWFAVAAGLAASARGASVWDEGLLFMAQQANATIQQLGIGATQFPNQGSAASGSPWTVLPASWWTCSFVHGIMWQLYNASLNSVGPLTPAMAPGYRTAVESWLPALASEQFDNSTHDVGFIMLYSYVLGYELTGNTSWRDVGIQTAWTLSTRYDAQLGVFRSWNSAPPDFLVIIDSTMNAPLLMWAGEQTGNETLTQMAYSHMETLMLDGLLRTSPPELNGCAYHVVTYNESSGAVIALSSQPQGYNATSLWSRGQAWGIYGYLQAFQRLRAPQFLETSRAMAQCYLRYLASCCSADSVPLFDFIIPSNITYRDTSAAAISASALLQLADIVGGAEGAQYRAVAEAAVTSLLNSSLPYRANPATSDATLLHGFTAWTAQNADTQLIYGDYYLLEALIYLARYYG